MKELNEKVNLLKISYFSHLLVSALIITINIFYEKSITVLMDLLSRIFFYIFISFHILLAIFQTIFLAVISGREKYKVFLLLLKILIGISLATLSLSLAMAYFYYITNRNYPLFYRDCPFNYHLSDINIMFIVQ